jgi:hypothetical protein
VLGFSSCFVCKSATTTGRRENHANSSDERMNNITLVLNKKEERKVHISAHQQSLGQQESNLQSHLKNDMIQSSKFPRHVVLQHPAAHHQHWLTSLLSLLAKLKSPGGAAGETVLALQQ